MILGIIGAILSVGLWVYGRYQGYKEGFQEAVDFSEKYLIANGWAGYRVVDGSLIFEVFKNDGQRTVDSNGVGKKTPPVQSTGG